MIEYKGYTAVLEVDVASESIIGHVVGMRDGICFQGGTLPEAVRMFHEAVDYYLAQVAADGEEPERPFSGRFNVRIDSDVHRRLSFDAEARKVSLNDVCKRAFAAYLAQTAVPLEDEDAGKTKVTRGRRGAVKKTAGAGL